MIKDQDLKERIKRASAINSKLKKLFPDAKIALNFKNNWELLVAVRLSAQCTDKKVNEVTPELFKRFKKISDYANASQEELEKIVKPTGFYRSKAKSIKEAAIAVQNEFKGKLPKTMGEMMSIPGVGRKSANVILGNAYGIVEGIAVDTHVKRLSKKLGLTKNTDPDKIEQDLMGILPRSEWFGFTYRLIDYGRKYCVARPHKHNECPLKEFHTT